MKLKVHHFDLPLRHPFTISRETTTVQPTVIVELGEGEQAGFGEATTNRYYGATTESITDAIESVRELLATVSMQDATPDQVWTQLHARLSDNPFALCAIDQAAHDLWGKLQGRPVYELWNLNLHHIPESCFTIGIDSLDIMVQKLNEMRGWPIYKIKLGTDHDVEIIRALRAETDAVFRVDANCGWQVEETIENATELKSLGVEFIEQPLPADNFAGHLEVFKHSPLPILADESCITENDVAQCAGNFHGVNIKLVKCGGLTPARRMIADAKRLGLSVMVGCMTESTVGISAIAQLLPMLDYVDMDGAALLASDIATGVRLEQGVCRFSTVPGNGVTLTSA